MKTKSLLLLTLALNVVCFAAEIQKPTLTNQQSAPLPATTNYAISSRDAHTRVWSRVRWTTNTLGRVSARTNSYHEIATGLNHKDAQGNWVDANAQITIQPN